MGEHFQLCSGKPVWGAALFSGGGPKKQTIIITDYSAYSTQWVDPIAAAGFNMQQTTQPSHRIRGFEICALSTMCVATLGRHRTPKSSN